MSKQRVPGFGVPTIRDPETGDLRAAFPTVQQLRDQEVFLDSRPEVIALYAAFGCQVHSATLMRKRV